MELLPGGGYNTPIVPSCLFVPNPVVILLIALVNSMDPDFLHEQVMFPPTLMPHFLTNLNIKAFR